MLSFVQLLLSFLDCSFVDFLQIFLEGDFPLNPIHCLFLVTKYDFDLFFESVFFVGLLHLSFLSDPYIKELQCILHCDFVSICFTVHQKLCQMKYLFRFDTGIFEHALFIHLSELVVADLLVEPFINLPDHQCYLLLSHSVLHFHLV